MTPTDDPGHDRSPDLPPEELQEILDALGGSVLSNGPVWDIEPVGSCSVPGLDGTEPPDLAVDLYPFPPTDAQRAALEGIGFTLRRAGSATWVFERPDRSRRLYLHEPESGRWHGSVILRDYLRASPSARARHAHSAGDRAAILDELEREARRWHVETTGFQPVLDIADELSSYRGRWMIASGWALDLHIGEPRRAHRDIDVTFPRTEQLALRDHLLARGWRLDLVEKGKYVPWATAVDLPLMQVHARRGTTFLDLLFAEVEGDLWRFRREPSITMPLVKAASRTASGVPYLAPEIVLLFKSSHHGGDSRGKDAQDFDRVLPHLDTEARRWLRDALEVYRPGHVWQDRLT